MAFPTVSGNVSITGTTAASLSKAWAGGHVADDIAIAFAGTINRQVATPAGWTLLAYVGTGTPGGAGATGMTVLARRATSGAEANLVLNNPQATELLDCGMLQFRGIPRQISLASLRIVTSVQAVANTAVSWPDPGSTPSDDALVLQALTYGINLAVPQASGYTNAALANITERQDVCLNVGGGGGAANMTGELHIAGPVGVTTATLANAGAQALASIILPSQSSGPSAAFLAQVASMLAKGPPFELDGIVYPTLPTLDTDCLVFTDAVPPLPGVAAGTTLRTVLNLAAVERMRSKNA